MTIFVAQHRQSRLEYEGIGNDHWIVCSGGTLYETRRVRYRESKVGWIEEVELLKIEDTFVLEDVC